MGPTQDEPTPDDDEPGDRRILARIDSGVDVTLIEEGLRRTPTGRLERMCRTLDLLDDARVPREP